MLASFTSSEMLRLWRVAAGLEPLRADCTVEIVEGIDTDAMILNRMRAWYLKLLDTAPAQLLPVADIAPDLHLAHAPGGAATATMPARARRIIDIRLSSWMQPAEPHTDTAAVLRLAANPYCAPGPHSPACTATGRHLLLTPACAHTDTVVRAMAVTDPGPETYILDETLLDTIPDILERDALPGAAL